jgi:hypothetical protein
MVNRSQNAATRRIVPISSTSNTNPTQLQNQKISPNDARYDPQLDLTKAEELEIDPNTGFYRKIVQQSPKKKTRKNR